MKLERPNRGGWRELVSATLLSAILGIPVCGFAAEERGETRREAPHYESPVLSLLLLPVNLLIRMASVLKPQEPAASRETPKRDER